VAHRSPRLQKKAGEAVRTRTVGRELGRVQEVIGKNLQIKEVLSYYTRTSYFIRRPKGQI
jgi:hypothetical protein